MTDDELVRLLLEFADDHEARMGGDAGIVRVGARRLAQQRPPLELDLPTGDKVCPRCGAPILQPAKGRKRIWCSDACRRNARNGGVAA